MLGGLFCLLVVAVLGYGGYLFGVPYYGYSILKNQAHSVVRMQGLTDEDILSKIQAEAAALDIELKENEIQLVRTPGKRKPQLRVWWDEDVIAAGYFLTTLYFEIDTKRGK